MSKKKDFNERITSKIAFEFPDFTKLPDRVRKKYDGLPTKVNFFRMLGYSPGSYVEIIDLTNAIFKNLKRSDYHKELLVLMVAAREGSTYEWEQHVSIAQAAGVREDQFIVLAEYRLNDTQAFVEYERILLNFGKTLIEQGKVPGVVFKHTLNTSPWKNCQMP